jgi:SAM-dependent methyltransferase
MEARAYDEMREIEDRHWWFRGRRRVTEPRVREALDAAPSGPVLDFGCGTGGTLASLAARTPSRRWIGFDEGEQALRLCAERGLSVALVRGTGPALPLRDASVACVLAFDAIEHCADDRALLADFARVLAPRGQLVATVPAYPSLWSQHDVALHHQRRYRAGELEERLRAAGFAVERRHGFNFLFLPLIALVRLFARRDRTNGEARTDFFSLPRPLETAIASSFWLERALLAVAPIPFGLSFVVRARKS